MRRKGLVSELFVMGQGREEAPIDRVLGVNFDIIQTYRSLCALPMCSRSRRGWTCRSGRARRDLVDGLFRLRTSVRC